MLQSGVLPRDVVGAGWYRDPVDRGSARFHDGKAWTKDTQPGASRLMSQHPTSTRRPRAALTRSELNNRHALTRWSWLGQYADVYL